MLASWIELAELAAGVTELAVQWLAQSAIVITAGLLAAGLLHKRSPAARSAVYQTTLVAALACPAVAYLLSAAGLTFFTLRLPPLRTTTIEVVAAPRQIAQPAEPALAPAGDRLETPQVQPQPVLDGPRLAEGAAAEFAGLPAASPLGPFEPNNALIAEPQQINPAEGPVQPAQIDPPPAPPQTRLVVAVRPALAALVIGASGAWLMVGVVLLGRLVAGHWQLARIRRLAIPVDDDVRRLLEQLSRQMNVPPPRLLRSPFVSSPCLAGILRPTILLPEDLSTAALSGVLVHELAHRRRRDCTWNLLRHVALAVLCPQPLLWRLSRKMEAAAEEVCDDYVVKFGENREAYAAALVSLAERNLLPASGAVVSLVTFRSLLAERVGRILDHSRRLSLAVGLAALSLIVAGGLSAALVAGLLGPEGNSAAAIEQPEDDDADEPAAEEDADDEQAEQDEVDSDNESPTERQVTGQVLLPDGRPAVGAGVVLLARRREGFQAGLFNASSQIEVVGQAQTDASGQFEFPAADLSATRYLWARLLARTDAHALAWRDVNADDPHQQFMITLALASEATGRLVTPEGHGAAGIRILVNKIGEIGKGQFHGAEAMDAELPPGFWPRDVVTDADGNFVVPGVAADADLNLKVDQEPFAPHWWVRKAGARSEHVQVLAPAQVITGVVVAADTGEPLPHARLTAFQGSDNPGGMTGVDGQADAEGRFRVNPYPANSYVVSAFAPAGAPHSPQQVEFEWPAAATEHEIRIELPRGVLLHGKVLEHGSGTPVAGASVRYEPRRGNPHDTDELLSGWQATVSSDRNGHYAIAVPPGPGYVSVLCPDGQYVVEPTTRSKLYEDKPGGRRLYLHAFRTFDLDAAASEEKLDLEVTRGAKILADVVGPDGNPPERLLVTYQGVAAPFHEIFSHLSRELASGRLEIHSVPPDGELTVFLLDPIRKHGRVVKLRGQDAGQLLEIELFRCGSATMRFVDADGNPVPGVATGLHITPGTTVFEMSRDKPTADETFVANFDRLNHWDLMSGEDGRIKYEALIPGVEYQLFGSDENGKPIVERTIRLQPGEQVRLDNYVIKDSDAVLESAERWRKAQQENENEKEPAAADPDDDLLLVRGRVVDPAGKPVPAARVVAVRFYWQNQDPGKPLSETASNANGEFEIAFRKSQFDLQANRPDQWKGASIAATAPGLGVGWVYYSDVEDGQHATLQLIEDQPIAGRIVDLEGNPVAGATLRAIRIYRNEKDDLSRWIAAMRRGIGFFGSEQFDRPNQDLPMTGFHLGKPIRTDNQGRFQLSGLGRDRYAVLKLTGPGIVAGDLRVASLPVKQFLVDYGDSLLKRKTICYGSEFQHTAEPSQPIQGVVRDARTGEPLPGVRVVADRLAGTRLSGVYAAETLSDDQGRYRLEGMPKGEDNGILAIPNDDQPYFMHTFDVPTAPGLQPVTFDLELNRGIWITGRLREEGTGKPIQARMYYLPWPDNPHIKDLSQFHDGHLHGSQSRYQTLRDGRFKLVGLPGRGLVAAACTTRPYPPEQGVREIADLPDRRRFMKVVGVFAPHKSFPTAVHEIRPAEDAKEIDVDFRLDPGERLKVRFVDAGGNPLSNLWVNGLWPRTPRYVAENAGPEAEVLALGPDEKRLLVAIDNQQRLGKATELSSQDVKDGAVTITLEPCATVKSRLLDGDGEPARAATIHFTPVGEDGFPVQLPQVATDENGVFVNTTIPSGCNYRILCESSQLGFLSVAEDLAVAPGETIDLGEFDVTSEDRPEPKRAATPTPAQAAAGASNGEAKAVVVRGRVVDPTGKPLAGATVWALSHVDDNNDQPQPRVEADAAGQFELRFERPRYDADTPDWRKVFVFAAAEGFGPAWMAYDALPGDKPITLALVADEPIEGRIVDLEGRPVAGARLRATAIARNDGEDLTAWLDALRQGETYRSVSFTTAGQRLGAPRDEIAGRQGPPVFDSATTNADGKFRITGLGRQRRAALELSRAGIVSTRITVVTVPTEALTVRFGNPEPFFDRDMTIFGSNLQYAAEPSQPIEGRVLDAKTGEPLAGVRVVAKKFAGKRMSEFGQTPVVSDAQGNYRLDGMPRGEGNLILVTPVDGQPYFTRELKVPQGAGLQAVKFDIELHRGVPIRGRVINQSTGKPVSATVRYVPWPDNSHLESTKFKPLAYNPTYPKTDRDGRFQLVGLPGQGLIFVECRGESLPPGQGLEALGETAPKAFDAVAGGILPSETYPTAIHKVEIAEDAEDFATDILLEPGKSVDLQVVDSAGQPLSGLNIRGLWPIAAGYRGKDLSSDVQVRGLKPDEKRWVLIHHPDRNLGRALEIDAAGAGAGPVRVVLEPCATVTARLLDKDGEPVRNGYVSCGIPQPDSWGLEWTETQTDLDGRLRSDVILPGGRYDVTVASPQTNWQSVAKGLTIFAGETVDLGEFDVTSEDRPEPQRTAENSPDRKPAANDVSEVSPLVIRGIVLDPDGKPKSGVVVQTQLIDTSDIFSEKLLRTAKTDAAGRFVIETGKSLDDLTNWSPSWPLAMTTATAPGYGPAWVQHNKADVQRECTLRLVADQPIEGRIVDLEAQPLAGVDVRVLTIQANDREDLSPWLAAMRSGATYRAAATKGEPQRRLGMVRYGRPSGIDPINIRAQSDAEGRFRLDGVGRGRLAMLRVSGGGIVAANVWVVAQPMEALRVEMGSGASPDVRTLFGAAFQYVAERSSPIEGVVRDANSGKPLAGVRILSDRFAGSRRSGYYLIETVSGADGRYRLEGMPHGSGNRILGMPPDDLPYLMRELDVPTGKPFETVKFDVELHRGVLIEGRVTDHKTGQGVSGRVSYLPWPDNPNLEGVPELTSRKMHGPQDHYRADAEGRYQLVGLPGRGLVVFWRQLNAGKPSAYPNGQGIDRIADLPADKAFEKTSFLTPRSAFVTAVKEVRAEAGDAPVVADISLREGDRIAVRIVDPQGNPLQGVQVRGLWPPGQFYDSENLGPAVEVAGLTKGETRQLLLEHAERRLGKGVKLSLDDHGKGPVDIKLEPFAKVAGRLLDNEGDPIRNVTVEFHYRAGANYIDRLTDAHTDADGRFTHDAVPSGVEFSIRCYSPQTSHKTLTENLTVAAGEKVDLGEINVFSDKRPKPKRTAADRNKAAGPTGASAVADSTMIVRGTVLDPEGKPHAGARVRLICWGGTRAWTNVRPAATETDASGRFAIEVPTELASGIRQGRLWPFTSLWASSEGFGPAVFAYGKEQATIEPTLRLVAYSPIEGRIVTLEGRPAPGVRVRVAQFNLRASGDLTPWTDALRKGVRIADIPAAIRPDTGYGGDQPDRAGNTAVTDAEGRFRLTSVARHCVATLELAGGGIVSGRICVANMPIKPIPLGDQRLWSDSPILYGSPFEFAAEPAQPIEGVVKDADTGEPIPGISVSSDRFAGSNLVGNDLLKSVSDEKGRYRLEGMPRGEGNRLVARRTGDLPYLTREFDVPVGRQLETIKFDLPLHRGVRISGQVRDAASGEPVAAKVVYLPWYDNPRIENLPEFMGNGVMGDDHTVAPNTDGEGRFTLIGLPGRGLVQVAHVDSANYPVGQGFDKLPDLIANADAFSAFAQLLTPRPQYTVAVQEVVIAEDTREVKADFALTPGQTVRLAAVDPEDQPVDITQALGLRSGRWGRRHNDLGSLIEVWGLAAGETRRVTLMNFERRLGATLAVSARNDPAEPRPVQLVPLAAIVGRLIDNEGEPLVRRPLHLQCRGDNGVERMYDAFTDNSGGYELFAVAASFGYEVYAEGVNGMLVKDLRVSPGETIDLGEINVFSDERPKPKRTAAKDRDKRAAVTAPIKDSKTIASEIPANRFEFAGKVVDPQGKPVAGAKVFVFYRPPGEDGTDTKPRAVTGADGSFEFAMPKHDFDPEGQNTRWLYTRLVAAAPGYGIAWSIASALEKSGELTEALRANPRFAPQRRFVANDKTLRLVADDVPLEGRIVTLEGQPVAGATVHVVSVDANEQNSLKAWLDAVNKNDADSYKARREASLRTLNSADHLAGPFPPVESDAEGRFRIAGIGRERIVSLRIEAPGYETRGISARTRPGPTLYVDEEFDRPNLPKLAYYGAKFDHALAISRPVVGVVRDMDTGQPMPGVRVRSNRYEERPTSGHPVTTDAEGRYRLEGLRLGENELIAIPPEGEPYLALTGEIETTALEETATLDFELNRGVWIRGQVTDAASGKPVQARIQYFAFNTNPHLRAGGVRLRIDDPGIWTNSDGRYAIVGLPGRGLITVMASNDDNYPRGAGAEKIEGSDDGRFRTWPYHALAVNAHALVEVNPDPDADAIEQNIALHSGTQVQGTVVDANGQPLAGAMCLGMQNVPYWDELDAAEFTIRHLEPGETRRLFFYHTNRKLAGGVTISGEEAGPVTVKLKPWGVITGRVLTADGDPADRVRLTGGRPPGVDEIEQGILPHSHDQHTDEEGHFKIEGLAPGFTYAVRASRGSRFLGQVIDRVEVSSGETKDLGDLTIHPRNEVSDPKPGTQGKSSHVKQAGDDEQITFTGKVVTPDGKPAGGTKIYLLQDVAEVTQPTLVTKTNADGRFAFSVAKADFNTSESSEPWLTAKLFAVADGRGMAWALAVSFETSGKLLKRIPLHPNFSDRHDEVATDRTLHLVADDVPIEGRVLDLEGKPVAGARVRVIDIARTEDANLDRWLEVAQDKDRAFHEAWKFAGISTGFNFRRQIERLFGDIRSGSDGRFQIRGIGRERIALLQIEEPAIETRQVSARTRNGTTIRILDPRWPDQRADVYYGSSFDHVAGPSRPVRGVVRDKDTGQPLAGVKVQANRLANVGVQPSSNMMFYTLTDDEGRYELTGLPVGKNELLALVPGDEPYLVSALPAEIDPAAESITVDFELWRGVWIRGRVTDAASGEPVPAYAQYFAFPSNPHLARAPGFADAFSLWIPTDREGHFQLAGMPGRGIVGVRARNYAQNYSDYPLGAGALNIEGRDADADYVVFNTAPGRCLAMNFHALAEVNPDENGGNDVHNFALVPGPAVKGTVFDPDGALLAGAKIYGAIPAGLWQQLSESSFTVHSVTPDKPRRVQFIHEERRLAGSLLVSGEEKGPITINLKAWATITGRVVDSQGDPLGDGHVTAADQDDPKWGVLSRYSFELDDEGRFKIEGLAPRVPYYLAAGQAVRRLGILVKDLELAPGETKDLGELSIKRSSD